MHQKRQHPHLLKLVCCQKLIDAYPDDLNCNLSTELQQYHSYIRHKFSAREAEKARFSHAE